MEDLDMMQRTTVAQARFDLLRNETALPPGPFPQLIPSLVAAPGVHLGYAVSPRGRALGVVATGSGTEMTGTVSRILTELTDARTARMFRTLAALQGHDNLRLEVVLGEPSHIRAGVRGFDDVRARVVLDEEGFPVSERDRLLGRGGVVGMDVVSDGRQPSTLATIAEADAVGAGLVGARRMLESRYAGEPDLRTVRRAGLVDRSLIDWLIEHGAGGSGAPGRLGAVHSILETPGPEEMGWTAGAISRSAVFYYRSPLPR